MLDNGGEIERIVKESEKKGTIAKLVSQNYISKNLAAKYRQILKRDHFPTLRTQWEALQEASKTVFETPVEMRVFAYNDKMETDTLMAPLDSIKYHRMFLQTGIMAVDPLSGHEGERCLFRREVELFLRSPPQVSLAKPEAQA